MSDISDEFDVENTEDNISCDEEERADGFFSEQGAEGNSEDCNSNEQDTRESTYKIFVPIEDEFYEDDFPSDLVLENSDSEFDFYGYSFRGGNKNAPDSRDDDIEEYSYGKHLRRKNRRKVSNKKDKTTENQKNTEKKVFRKPDITSLILACLLLVFAVYYIVQVYLFDDGGVVVVSNVTEADVTDINKADAFVILQKININTADIEQLCTLNGIGEVKAAAIIEYREKNGMFSSIEDIKNVSGIGDATYEKIKEYICSN